VGFGPGPGRAHIVGVATPILTRATDVSDRQQTEALRSIARPVAPRRRPRLDREHGLRGGFSGSPGLAHYDASKAALAPGFIPTEASARLSGAWLLH
jgi:hypothetical protein